MQEKRREKRIDVTLYLKISTLFKQDNVLVQNIDAPITVINISRGGIGFYSKSNLPIGFYFNACIQLGDEDAKLYCVVKIIRAEEVKETSHALYDIEEENDQSIYRYGCEFIGMAPVLSYIFENFEKSLED
ncbi:PilZ domain-containing protein [Lachnoclostridium phytofermentans]|uniref:Type IV pilus assembly PilZ n=1 Tax=Lachnoclostridium phytofermentans (strain ATCC 700394 / DSM 18823 / ISDg) TaxID=357809 RepID=A9KJ28_LACP7|nr:PilZ domain-containing protein [Lachnoclostridium phytofermentans]ABX41027.1 type IV pilus assembly PilZ [Lachnoclostridium phytofermentans ISDg]